MKEITRRYLAGLLDGEGYFGIMRKQNGWHIPTIKMVLTNEEVLSLVVRKLGGHVHKRLWPEGSNWKTAYCWENRTYVQVDKVLRYVHEYLIVKKAQADILRDFLDTKVKTENNNTGSTPLPKEILSAREKYYYLMSKLNQRGLPPAENKRDSSTKVDEAMFRSDMKISDAERNLCAVAI